jgi:hypothetical protein
VLQSRPWGLSDSKVKTVSRDVDRKGGTTASPTCGASWSTSTRGPPGWSRASLACPRCGPYEMKADPELRARMEARLNDADPVVVADARALLAYLNELEALIALAQRTREQTRLKGEPGTGSSH